MSRINSTTLKTNSGPIRRIGPSSRKPNVSFVWRFVLSPKSTTRWAMQGSTNMETWNIYWAPEGRKIATIEAKDAAAAKKQTPLPFRKFKGEVYVISAKEDAIRLGQDQW